MARADRRQRERARKQRRAEERRDKRTGNTSDPIRGGRAEYINPARQWHLVRTVPLLGPLGRKFLDEGLDGKGVHHFRPRISEVVIRRGRRVVRHVPLLIRTIIVGVWDEEHLDKVAKLPGVAEVVTYAPVETETDGNASGSTRHVARLDPVELQRFCDALAEGEIVQPTGLRAKQSVMVMTGPFASFPGTVEEILANDRIRVSISIFGRLTVVVLGIADVAAA